MTSQELRGCGLCHTIVNEEEGTVKEKKPRLRRLSSMTAEEEDVWRDVWFDYLLRNVSGPIRREEAIANLVKSHKASIDWLTENSFDIDNMIENGMAEEMNLEIDEDAIC